MTRVSAHTAKLAVSMALLALCILTVSAGNAFAAPAPGWELTTRTYPTNLPPGGKGVVEVALFNIGAGVPSHAITVTDFLPPGLTATNAGEYGGGEEGAYTGLGIGIKRQGLWECSGTTVVTCTLEHAKTFPEAAGGAGAGWAMRIIIAVKAAEHPQSGSEVNRVTAVGGGAPTPASISQPVTISSAEPGFGFTGWDVWFANEDGTIDTQAGSHPYSATFSFALATKSIAAYPSVAGGNINSIESSLPPGLVGDPHAVPQCTRQQLNSNVIGGCPATSQIGILTVPISESTFHFRVYNMVPPAGVPAEFGFTIAGIVTFLDASVRSGSDYGITEHINDVPQRGIEGSTLTLWGYPGAASHGYWREDATTGEKYFGCDNGLYGPTGSAGFGSECPPLLVTIPPKAFLTLPTSCVGPQSFSIRADTWQNTNVKSEMSILSHDSTGSPTGYTGCDHLNFAPAISLAPDTSYADTPAGLTVDVKPSVGGLSEVGGLSTADIQNTKVTLPTGVAINPGQAAGLQACQPSQDGVGSEGAPSCPSASKVGTVSIETPLLTQRMEGNVYVVQSNPPNLQLLVAASAEGVNVKLIGNVHLDEATGQLSTTFMGTPELPFTNFKLSFSGGAQAALATPSTCGTYTSSADFGSWSSPFIAEAVQENGFQITAGTGGASCPSLPLPFSPALIAGSTTDQAGGYTDFSLLLQAPDDQQRISRLQFRTPEGLLGMISQVPLCGEPQASAGTCSSASQIGHTVVASGPGPYPLIVPQPGQPPAAIYLTGPYGGAPYGLSIVVPLNIGPFTLQTQVVRAKIEVDPLTSELTVTTDPLPQIIDGVPTDLRTINAVIDRPGFMFNPTNCSPMSFSGTAWGTPPPGVAGPGSTAAISSHFQMGSCQSLTFKPDFQVSTAGKTSRKNGASLDVRVIYPIVAVGHNQASGQANIAQVKVDLPKQLPSRLTTLQKACTAATFEANPAACPAESRVGNVTAITPVLPVALTGPAIFVSNAGLKFPELVFVLQGYGVTVYVHAETFINKAGITSSTIHHVPDVPITSFELKLPQGPYSALAANGNLCKAKLTMPTAFVGQNGASVHQSTPITVTGCPKAKKAKAKKASKRHKGTKRGKK